jgi:HK97 family phage major capsid protein
MTDDLLARNAIRRARQSLDGARKALDLADDGRATPPLPLSRMLDVAEGLPSAEIPRRILDASEAFTRRGFAPQRGGYVVPVGEFGIRDLTTVTTTGTAKAGNLLGSARLDVARELAAPAVTIAAGARVLELASASGLPIMATPPVASWVGENSAPAQASPVLGLRAITPATVAVYVDVSRRLRLQAANLDAMLNAALRRAIARAIDAAVLGTGGGDTPVGILGTTGRNVISLGTSGALSRAKLADMVEAVATDGGMDGDSRLAFIVPPPVAGKLSRTEAASGSGYLLDYDGRGPTARVLGDMPTWISGGAPSATAIYGDWSRVVVAFFGGVEIIADPRANAAQGTTRLAAFADVAVTVEAPEAFATAASVNVS